MAAPKKIDYDSIEPGWRAGLLSPHQLAAAYTEQTGTPVSHAAIIKHFRKLGIPRDLSKKIMAKAESMVTQAMVTGKVTTETIKRDSEIVDCAAISVANIQLSQRADIRRARTLSIALLAELESQTGNFPEMVELGEILRQPNESGADKLNDIYRAVISLPERTKTMKSLAETLKHLVGLERESYGLKAEEGATVNAAIQIMDYSSFHKR